MCGIAGKLDFAGPVDRRTIERMTSALAHRGPDSQGIHVEDGVGLGAQRLAIIDVPGGDQPITNEDGTVTVVLNGEIYNFAQLRKELTARGHRFSTRSDTEVLVHLYEDRGEAMVEHLRGMFAFAIWDRRRRRLLLARDRVGKKPLFWVRRGTRFWFASEIGALLEDQEIPRDVDPEAIDAYLALGYVPHPQTGFQAIRKLPPATTMAVSASGEHRKRYWTLRYEPKLDGNVAELGEELSELIDAATRVRMVSEVPLGAFLSGGIDSSAVVAAMARNSSGPVKTFSIGFGDDDFDELDHARRIAQVFGTDHHELQVEPDAVAVLPLLARHFGEPFADPSAIPTYHLAKMASDHVTVALTGDGGDESFAGYPRYVTNLAAARLAALPSPVRSGLARLRGLPGGRERDAGWRNRARRLAATATMDPPERFASWVAPFDHEHRARVLRPEFARPAEVEVLARRLLASTASEHLDRMLDAEIDTYLADDLLPKVDITTMANSLEARSPLLDHELMEFAARLPVKFKLRGRTGKWLLKRSLAGTLPESILARPKMGFSLPLARWLREDLRELTPGVLLDPTAASRGWLEPTEVERLIGEHSAGTGDHAKRLWTLLQLELWHREVVDRDPVSR